MDIFRVKTIKEVLESADTGKSGLKKSLGVMQLFLLGLGAIIGTGIFVMTGIAAVSISGPAVVISYGIAGITTIFVALCYTEVATMIPTSGGAYSYSFVAFGEIVAWLVSWMMILYFLLSASTVAAGWSGYMVSMLKSGGINLPDILTKIPTEGGIVNLPAVLMSLAVTAILVRGTSESAKLNAVLVTMKIVAIAIFVFVAAPNFNVLNLFEHNAPVSSNLYMSNTFMPFGISGVLSGSAFVFFAYNGFDSIASAAEECKNPKRDLTIAILGSLVVCMALYMLVAALLVGGMPFNLIDVKSSISSALSYHNHKVAASLISAGVVIGMVSVVLVQIFALSRIVLVTARDGLLPPSLAKIHPKYKTPYISTVILGVLVAIISGLLPLKIIGTLSSVGALFSFMIVSVVMLVLRYKYPDVKRTFRCPMAPLVAGIGILLCLCLLGSAMQEVGMYVVAWMLIGVAVYFAYARSASRD